MESEHLREEQEPDSEFDEEIQPKTFGSRVVHQIETETILIKTSISSNYTHRRSIQIPTAAEGGAFGGRDDSDMKPSQFEFEIRKEQSVRQNQRQVRAVLSTSAWRPLVFWSVSRRTPMKQLLS